jgi:A/G-specific adenine glycosylase
VTLAQWYARNGRHDLPWRARRDRWSVLVSEVMLHQTQVARVADAFPAFIARFPDPSTTAAAGPAAVIGAWGRLGYPRRARRLWDAAVLIDRDGWPADLTELPGVGRYTAGAVAAQTGADDAVGVEVNIRRVCERTAGRRLAERDAEAIAVELAQPMRGRDRLLALMDLGATVCTARAPRCAECPLAPMCATRGILDGETKHRQGEFAGSFRQRRGVVMARLRAGPVAAHELDRDALRSLVADGLASITRGRAHLPTR